MTANASMQPGAGRTIKIVLGLSVLGLALSGVNTVMIVSDRASLRAAVDQLRRAEQDRTEDGAAAERRRQEQEQAASQAMRFR